MLVSSPNRVPYFLFMQFRRIWLFNFHSLFHLINSLFLITSYIILFELCNEKLDVDKLPGAERVKCMQVFQKYQRKPQNVLQFTENLQSNLDYPIYPWGVD